MVSEFVVVWVELNWLRDVAGSVFFVKRDARQACAACHRGFVGGWLLGCRNSAKSVFQKFELASLKQRTFVKQRRFPPAKNQLPSCRVSQKRCTLHGWLFRAGGLGGFRSWVFMLGDLGWLLRGWMRHQRCAGCLGGKAEFPCGLAGVDVGLWDNFWNSFG